MKNGEKCFRQREQRGRRDQLDWSVVVEERREVGRAAWAVDVFAFYSKGSREPWKVLSWD